MGHELRVGVSGDEDAAGRTSEFPISSPLSPTRFFLSTPAVPADWSLSLPILMDAAYRVCRLFGKWGEVPIGGPS